MTSRTLRTATRAVRAGIASDIAHGAVVPPLHLSSTFSFAGFGQPRTYDYTRSGNPTRSQLAEALAELEGGASAVVTSTGMSAVTLVLQLLAPGDLIVAAHDCYGGTQRLLRSLAKRGLFDVRFDDLTAPDAAAAITAGRKPKVVWIETPSNPLLRITDIRAIANASRAAGALVVVDNTFLSPALQQPLELGADLVVHSTTKYLNGHSDVVGGAVVARDTALGQELGWWANCLGITGAPFDSYLTLRGVRTLFPRMQQHLENAARVVEALAAHPAVSRVYYPGLESHPGHELAAAQQSGFGAMVSFELAGGVDAVKRCVEVLRCFTLAESLGGVESLVAHPATMTHASMDAGARANAGIGDSLLRLSVGIEDPDDLVADLVQALDASRVAAAPVRAPRATARARKDAVDVVLLGAGTIGRELLWQLTEREEGAGDAVRVCGVVDRSGFLFDRAGLSRGTLDTLRVHKAAGGSVATLDGAQRGAALEAIGEISRHALSRPILVDVTAADTGDVLSSALVRGWDLVLANKVPLAADRRANRPLYELAQEHGRRLLHEATVGAGLPVLDTLRKLQESGDRVLRIEGCPSGTLGYLFGELGRGRSFSDSLRAAVGAGYTEPDPRVDLSGLDVARKALILARLIGFDGDLADVSVESLVPESLRNIETSDFLARLGDLDSAWEQRVQAARAAGQVLRYRAQVTPAAVTVGLVAVEASDPLASLSGTDNQFSFTTSRYRQQPLVITGPGAGPAVTAAGVVNDILRLAAEPGATKAAPRSRSKPASSRREPSSELVVAG